MLPRARALEDGPEIAGNKRFQPGTPRIGTDCEFLPAPVIAARPDQSFKKMQKVLVSPGMHCR